MERADIEEFGRLLLASHTSLRDRLCVSSPALNKLVEAAMESGAVGARLTGAGFGGCAVVLCRRPEVARVRSGLLNRYYAGRPEFDESRHLIDAEPDRARCKATWASVSITIEAPSRRFLEKAADPGVGSRPGGPPYRRTWRVAT